MCRLACRVLVADTAAAVVQLIQILLSVMGDIIAPVERLRRKMELNVREDITAHKALLTIYYVLRATTVEKRSFQMSVVFVKRDIIARMDLFLMCRRIVQWYVEG